MELADWRRAFFVDFEAVPDAEGRLFPVEIGVSIAGGRTQSSYIRPRKDWLPAKPSWGHQEKILERAMTAPFADDIAGWIVTNFVDRPLVSDAVFVDAPLLDRLLEGTGREFQFVSFFTVIEDLKKAASVNEETFNSMITDIDEHRGEAHAAGEDARVRAELVSRLLALAISE